MAAVLRDQAQRLVPSDRVILLCRLYLPTGLSMGMRLTSLKVAASKTISAPPSALRYHRLAAGAYWSNQQLASKFILGKGCRAFKLFFQDLSQSLVVQTPKRVVQGSRDSWLSIAVMR